MLTLRNVLVLLSDCNIGEIQMQFKLIKRSYQSYGSFKSYVHCTSWWSVFLLIPLLKRIPWTKGYILSACIKPIIHSPSFHFCLVISKHTLEYRIFLACMWPLGDSYLGKNGKQYYEWVMKSYKAVCIFKQELNSLLYNNMW